MLFISKDISQRIKALNIISILMVVGIHSRSSYNLPINNSSYIVQEFLCNGLYMVAVPLLFLISGVLFFRNVSKPLDGYTDKIKSRFRSLIIPYLIYSFFALCLLAAIQFIASHTSLGLLLNNSSASLLQKSPMELFSLWILSPVVVHLWFLRDLFLLVLFSPVIAYLINRFKTSLVFCLLALWLLAIEPFPIINGFHVIKMESLMFFTLGADLVRRKLNLDLLMAKLDQEAGLIAVTLWVLTNAIRVAIDPTFEIFNRHHFSGPGLLLHKVGILVGILAMLFISRFLIFPKTIYLSGFSFFIYLVHMPLCWYIGKVVYLLTSRQDAFLFFLTHGLTCLVAILLGIIFKQVMPNGYAILTGGRGS